MAYFADYPKKPKGNKNPYYACAYCGITDPQINGVIKNHSSSCEYRLFKEFGTPFTHDGYGNEIPVESLSWQDKSDILLAEGWKIISQEPLVLSDKNDNFLKGLEAKKLFFSIIDSYEN